MTQHYTLGSVASDDRYVLYTPDKCPVKLSEIQKRLYKGIYIKSDGTEAYAVYSGKAWHEKVKHLSLKRVES